MNVGLTSPRIEKYALLYPSSKSLQKMLCNYYAAVVELCMKIVLFVRKTTIRQIASTLRKPFDDEFGVHQKELDGLGTAVASEVSLASKGLQNSESVEATRERKESSLFRATGAVFRRDITKELERARRWEEKRSKSQYLSTCSIYNHETSLNQARKKGASSWIFETGDYKRWRSTVFPATFLCSGIVGSGKTVLSASVVEELTLNKIRDFNRSDLAYFFCRDDDAVSLSAREIVGSLARQLLGNTTSEIFSSLASDVGDIRLDSEQIVSHMLLLLPQHIHHNLLIDGLDECDDKEVTILVESLQPLLKSSEHVFKLFITARTDFVCSQFYLSCAPLNLDIWNLAGNRWLLIKVGWINHMP